MNEAGLNLSTIEHVLNLRAAQHQLIASNIANEETPGFRAKELRFSEALSAAKQSPPVTLQTTHPGHLSVASNPLEQFIQPVAADTPSLDGNTVNLEIELTKLSDNAMQYNTAAALVAREYKELLGAIREGR